MLSEVSNQLQVETEKYLKPVNSRESSIDANPPISKDSGILNNMRSMLNKRTRSRSLLTPQSPTFSLLSKKTAKVTSKNNFTTPDTPSCVLNRNFAFEPSTLIYERNSFSPSSVSKPAAAKFQNIDNPLEKINKHLNTEVSPNLLSMEYISELHAEIEQLQTDKLRLLQTKLENHQEIVHLRNRQAELEKSLDLVRKEAKLLRIGKTYIN